MKKPVILLVLSLVLAIAGGCAGQPAAQPTQPPEPTTPPQPAATEEPVATATNTSPPEPTATEEPTAEPTDTPPPEPTATEEPTATPQPTVQPTNTPEPTEEAGVTEVDREQALALIKKANCQICHTAPGVDFMMGQTGPNWCVPAKKVQSGEQGLDYIRQSILNPNAVIADGYSPDIMPKNFGEILTDEEVNVLVNFIAGLQCE